MSDAEELLQCYSDKEAVGRINAELLQLAILQLISDFNIEHPVIKASNTPERVGLLEEYGFQPTENFRSGFGYYKRNRQE